MKPFAYYCEERNANGELIDKEYNGINQFSAGRFGKPLYTAEQLEASIIAEREACAKACDSAKLTFKRCGFHNLASGANECAAAIRARGEK